MPRPCLICSSVEKTAKAFDLISKGLSDQAVADALNDMAPQQIPMSFMAVNRHRRLHVVKVAQDQIAIASKGSAPRRQRERLAVAAAKDTLSTADFIEANFGARATAEDIIEVKSALKRTSKKAEAKDAHKDVAAIASQQLNAIRTGAQLASIPSFVPARVVDQGSSAAPPFSVNIVFSGAGRTEEITMTATPPTVRGTVIDQVADDPDTRDDEYDPINDD